MQLKRPHHRCTPEEYKARKIALIRANLKVVESGCHEWQGYVHRFGYGFTSYKGKTRVVHRLLWTLINGPVPRNLDVCHTCDNRRCCNLDHLWIGTRQENLRDAANKGRAPGQDRETCVRGHPYDETNTTRYGKTKWRNCRICLRARNRIKAGWPEDLAYSMPAVPHGYTPVKGKFPRKRKAA